ncbi:hypothetical protein [Arthrobacter sp. AZCC_0090]|uniref:hypothetical protein n=1 Tax=Arthrobacter sp. AZCC_0090 TaxID=2735881 RepID=UPI00161C1642|nr:hypothetical protein [Arthrobacter sp. AZCC_0090]MBB6406654.1 hypothetical protein [Arthrobacter sp. AZCC_0090]
MMRWDCKDIDRDAIIHELLLEAGLADAPALTDSLKALESFASMPAPIPGQALAALLAGTAVGVGPVAGVGLAAGTGAAGTGAATADPAEEYPLDELGKRRQLRKHRPAVIGAAVLTAMGLGIGGVAASSSGFSKGTPDFMQSLISDWAPGWTTAPPSLVPPAPAGDSPKVTTHPAPVDLPAPAVAPEPVIAPVPEAAPPPAVEPSPDVVPSPTDPAEMKDSPKQGTVGRPGVPKTAHTEPKTDSQGVLKQATDTLPKWSSKEFQDGLQQVLQDSKADPSGKSQGASLRWLFGLAR